MIKKTMVKTQKTMRSGNMIVILDVDEQQLPEVNYPPPIEVEACKSLS